MSALPLANQDLLCKIESFSLLSKLGISKLESTEYEDGDYKWKLIIYPDGDEVGKKANHISVHMTIVGTSSLPAGWEVNAILSFFLYNHTLKKYYCLRGKPRRFNATTPEIRCSKFVAKKTFTDPSHGYVLDDNCEFGAEVFTGGNIAVVDRMSLLDLQDPRGKYLDLRFFSKQKDIWCSRNFNVGGYNWKIDLHPKTISSSRFRHYPIYLHCTDAESFGVSTKVLATCKFTYENIIHNKTHSNRVSHWFTSSDQKLCLLGMAISDVFPSSKDAAAFGHCKLDVQIFVEAIHEAFDESV